MNNLQMARFGNTRNAENYKIQKTLIVSAEDSIQRHIIKINNKYDLCHNYSNYPAYNGTLIIKKIFN